MSAFKARPVLVDQAIEDCGRHQGSGRGCARRQTRWCRSTPHHHPRLRPALDDPANRPTSGKTRHSRTSLRTGDARGLRLCTVTHVPDDEFITELRDQGVVGVHRCDLPRTSRTLSPISPSQFWAICRNLPSKQEALTYSKAVTQTTEKKPVRHSSTDGRRLHSDDATARVRTGGVWRPGPASDGTAPPCRGSTSANRGLLRLQTAEGRERSRSRHYRYHYTYK